MKQFRRKASGSTVGLMACAIAACWSLRLLAPKIPLTIALKRLWLRLRVSLAWGLIKNHAFIDGNKRVGLAALLIFLDTNLWRLSATEDQARDGVLQAAAGDFTEEQWTEWVVAHCGPV